MCSLKWSSDSTEILLGLVFKIQVLERCGLHCEEDAQAVFRSSHLTAYTRVGAGAIICAESGAGEAVDGMGHQGQICHPENNP